MKTNFNLEPGTDGYTSISLPIENSVSTEDQFKDLELSEEIKKLLIEGKAKRFTIETGGRTGEEYKKDLEEKRIHVDIYAAEMLGKMETMKNCELIDYVQLTDKDLGLENRPETGEDRRPQKYPTAEEVCKRAEELGLDLVPASAGPELALADINPWTFIGMKPIDLPDSGFSMIFQTNGHHKLWARHFKSQYAWDPDNTWIFRLRKKEGKS